MTAQGGTVADFFDILRKCAPETVDLFIAKTDEQFENAFCALLERAVMHLEANKKNFLSLDEAGLSAVLAAKLSMPGLAVTQEEHSNGHVDLTISVEHFSPARVKLGEAKIYDGPAYHVSGLKQLLGRYTTGREKRGLLLVYCRSTDIAGKVASLRQALDTDRPFNQQGPTATHPIKWSFRSQHLHTCGDVLGVDHVGCNLCTE